MKVAILGAGNGGVCMGAFMALKGAEVNLYDKFESAIVNIREKGSVSLDGVSLKGEAEFNIVSSRISDVIEGCQLIMVVTPAFAHKEIAEECAKYLKNDQVIVLHPGRTGGAMEFFNIVKTINPSVNVTVAEAQTLIYACRKIGPTEAKIMGVKDQVAVASIPSQDISKAMKLLNVYYPEFYSVENVFETSLLNIGAIFHPLPTLLNIARIESGISFEYYHDGITKSVAKIMERVDMEIQSIAGAFEIKTISANEWMKQSYHSKGDDLYTSIHENPAYAGISAPKTVDTRYLSEDVPMSLTPLSELGKLAGVATPYIDMIIEMASSIHGKDYREEGRTLGRMGIDYMSVDSVLKYIEDPNTFSQVEV